MKSTKESKIFVLDTNVILHDFRSIHNFQENDIVIPIAVIEELDKFKKGNEQINYNARQFIREMDKITDNRLFDGGITIGKGKGKIKIEIGHPFTEKMSHSLFIDNQDHRILSTTLWLTEQNPNRQVVLVTKDINLRMKAKALQLFTEDYLSDKVSQERIESISRGVKKVKIADESLLQKLYYQEGGVPIAQLGIKGVYANQNLVLEGKESSKDVAAKYIKRDKSVVAIRKGGAYGIEPRNREQAFALDALLDPAVKLVALTGSAGTGKTLLALAAALEQEREFNQVLLSRPVIPLKNQEMGFLPGDVKEKMGPYMIPLFDNLAVIKRAFKPTSREVVKIEEMLRGEKLLISPLAYIRGRSLSNTFFIIDEAQNLTPHEVKTIITRAAEETKLVFTGDIDQIDSPYLDKHSNGLSHLVEKLLGEELFAHINLVKGERSELSELAGRKL